MQPFAIKSGRRLGLHWWITAGVAAAFLVWNFDLVPRIRNAATGAVVTSEASLPLSELDDTLDADWGSITEHSTRSETANIGLQADDPLLLAIAAQSETSESHEGATSPEMRSDNASLRPRAIADSSVTRASYAETDSADSARAPHESIRHGVISADVAARLRSIDASLREDRILEAHAELSRIYWKHSEIRDQIQERIDRTASLIFTTTERQFAAPHFVEYGETLETIAAQYDVPWMYLAMLNRVTPNKLQAGQQLKVVRGPFAAVVDLDEFALTVHAHGWYVHRYEIGIGRDHRTPTGEFTVLDKLENPTWYNPDGEVVEADDPENPLGEYWLGLGNHIGIHGTIDPDSIGRAASRGCIHLNDEDIAEVFGLLGIGSKVLIRK